MQNGFVDGSRTAFTSTESGMISRPIRENQTKPPETLHRNLRHSRRVKAGFATVYGILSDAKDNQIFEQKN